MREPALIMKCWEMGSRLDECRLLAIPRFADERGSLSPIEGPPILPFEPKRFYYLYELPPGAHRGCHAHKTEEELIVALAGGFKVAVNDGNSTKEFELNSPDQGLYVPALLWHEVYGFAPGSVCAVVASERYNPDDYYYSFEDFLHALPERG
jgi:dTDP-4-dehydrorhamnose 3,5-epimerase-like enzyme